jgi:hypothetical protein
MATRYVNTASSAGGDGTTNGTAGANRAYATLAEWEAARQAVLSEIEEVICEGTAADTGQLTIDGWTTTSSFYIDIKALSSAGAGRHAGVWSTSKYRLSVNGGAGVGCSQRENFTRITGLQAEVHTFANRVIEWASTAGGGRVTECILRGTRASSYVGMFVNSASGGVGSIFIVNNVVYTLGTGISQSSTNDAVYVYNNTVYDCDVGIDGHFDAATRAKNNVVQNCTTDWTSDFHADSAYNNSEDGTHPGSNGQTGTVTFVNAGSFDLHLSASDTVAKVNGVDLRADAGFPFDVDIDEQARGAVWDMGADQIPAAAAGDPPPALLRSRRPAAFTPGLAR